MRTCARNLPRTATSLLGFAGLVALLALCAPQTAAAGRSTFNVIASQPDGRGHVVPVQMLGLQPRAEAVLNGSLRASFVLDTGAMVNSIPRELVEALGIEIGPRTPRATIRGITGAEQRVPVVTVDLDLGGAVVKGVEMVVSDSLDSGLIGMSFFQHFVLELDTAAGTLRLQEREEPVNASSQLVSYRLAWGAVAGAARYCLEIAREGGFDEPLERGYTGATSAELRELLSQRLAPGTYYWRVAAEDVRGARGPWSQPRGFLYH